MADSDWTQLEGAAARDQEAELTGLGELPPVGGKKWVRVETFDPPAPQAFASTDPITGVTEVVTPDNWECTRTRTYYLLTRQGVTPPAAIPVQQHCNRCNGHTHSLTNSQTHAALGVPFDSAHVDDGQYGWRHGNLYSRFHVRGTVLERTDRITKFVPQPGGATLDSMQSPEQEKAATWRKMTVDHTEQGPHVAWTTRMTVKNCKTHLDETFGMLEDAAEGALLAALTEEGLDPGYPLLNDGGAISTLLATAAELEQPMVRAEWNEKEGFSVVLEDASGEGAPKAVGRAKLTAHDEGFSTLDKWSAD